MKNSVDSKKPPIINERIFETSDTPHMNAASYKNIGASLVIFVEMAGVSLLTGAVPVFGFFRR